MTFEDFKKEFSFILRDRMAVPVPVLREMKMCAYDERVNDCGVYLQHDVEMVARQKCGEVTIRLVRTLSGKWIWGRDATAHGSNIYSGTGSPCGLMFALLQSHYALTMEDAARNALREVELFFSTEQFNPIRGAVDALVKAATAKVNELTGNVTSGLPLFEL